MIGKRNNFKVFGNKKYKTPKQDDTNRVMSDIPEGGANISFTRRV